VASFWAACFLLNGVVFKDSKTKQNNKKKPPEQYWVSFLEY
jgi:hypothetical protein